MTKGDNPPTENVSNLVMCRLMFICWKDLRNQAYLLHKLRHTWSFKTTISKNWKSVKVSIILGFSRKLINHCNLVIADHKQDSWKFSNVVFTRTVTPNSQLMDFLATIEYSAGDSRGSPSQSSIR